MGASLTPGQTVQTPMGKGVVEAVRNNGRVLVRVQHRAVVMAAGDVRVIAAAGRAGRKAASPGTEAPAPATRGVTVDLHGLTVEQALVRSREALNDAVLDDVGELRFVHGRSGGRIRAALHRLLREIPIVRAMRIDPRNAGVTIVML